MSDRFSYVKYDAESTARQEELKSAFEAVEKLADGLAEGSAKSLVMIYLEIAYMWTGKAIRDEQVADMPQTPHVPERGE
jgi:hypothetical protein